jgi:hypothetical protein
MEKTINESFVKLSSRVPFPLPLELGQDVNVTIDSQHYIYNVVKSEDLDKQDGSIDRVFTLKSISE